MFIFQAEALRKDWNGKTLFENIDMDLKKVTMALFGSDDVGKSMLLNGSLGKISFDYGNVQPDVPVENGNV